MNNFVLIFACLMRYLKLLDTWLQIPRCKGYQILRIAPLIAVTMTALTQNRLHFCGRSKSVRYLGVGISGNQIPRYGIQFPEIPPPRYLTYIQRYFHLRKFTIHIQNLYKSKLFLKYYINQASAMLLLANLIGV